MTLPLTIISDRINPGFKSTRVLLEAGDMPGLQALAKKEVEQGSSALDFTIGPRAGEDPQFLAEAIRVVQAAVNVPLCFDYPSADIQEMCLKVYDPAKANGAMPIVNSLAETRWEMMDLMKIQRFRVMLMASERLENGIGKPNTSGEEIAGTARRVALRLTREYGVAMSDIIVDVSICALVSDMAGLNRAALEAIGKLGSDPALRGIHISGGITNIGQQLPPKAADGSNLKRQVQCAFLTLAVPLGMDTVLASPSPDLQLLPEGNFVLETFKQILPLSGTDVLRQVRKLYTK
ncbi:MAG: dihydropteroate synthase [Burkholderiales bacterium]|nr:dihydropteroate synthase [Burkholderiales bacterium]